MSGKMKCPMDRPAKLRKLEDFKRKVPALSASALAGVLQEVRESGLPDLVQRKHVREATIKTLEKHDAYGPIMKSICLAEGLILNVVNLASLLQGLLTEATGFAELLMESMARHKGECMNLILYTDEVNAGNPLAVDQNRKFWIIYVSLMEFGGVALGKEQAWLPLACPRSSSVSALPGGVSQVVATVLKDIFLGPVDPEHAGLTLKSLDGSLHRLKFKLGCFVQDGQAHKMMFPIKGDQGTRCCALCQNIIASTADLEDSGCIRAAQAYKEEQLVLTTEESWANSIISLIEKKDELSKGDFALWQQASGLSYNSHALIFDPDLCHMIRPVTQLVHDYMHGFFVKGIWKLGLQLAAFLPYVWSGVSVPRHQSKFKSMHGNQGTLSCIW